MPARYGQRTGVAWSLKIDYNFVHVKKRLFDHRNEKLYEYVPSG